MSHKLNRHCTRRLRTCPLVENCGAGSGGDPGTGQEQAGGSKYVTSDKNLLLSGNSIELYACTLSDEPDPYRIIMHASDDSGLEGSVTVRGGASVRITSGGTDAYKESTMGVDIAVGDTQEVHITRGIDEEPLQSIDFEDDGMTINGDTEAVTIFSDKSIYLSVAQGTSSIMLTPAGIVLKGPLIRIN